MYEEENYAALVLSAKAATEQRNRLAADTFEQAAQNWARNVQQTGQRTPPPVAPNATELRAVRETMDYEMETLPVKVSDLNPESLLPKFATDINAIGGRIGGPIPNTTGIYYAASGAACSPGDAEIHNGITYEFRAPFFGLGGYWVVRP